MRVALRTVFGVTPRARNRFLGWRLARGIAFWGDASREESLFGVTPCARRHPKKCEASPQKMRGVTPKNARRHPNACEASPQRLRGVTPTPARRHPNACEASPQRLRGVTPTPARRHPNACEESPRKWRDGPSPVFQK